MDTSIFGDSLAGQWLGLCVSTARGSVSIPGGGTVMPQAPELKNQSKTKS